MAEVPVPGGLEDVTPEWLTAVLRQNGVNAQVASVTPKNIGEGTGANGVTARVTITYTPGRGSGPGSLVIKLPATSPAVKEVAVRQQFYQNEIHFYQELAHRVAVTVPRSYFSGMDEAAGRYALLLEDMAPAVVGDDLTGCTYEEAELAVVEIAKLHAGWWDSPELDLFTWLPTGEPNLEAAHVRFNEVIFPGLMANYGHTLSSEVKRVCEAYCKNFSTVIGRIADRPNTLTHSDYRLVNLLIGGLPSAGTVTVVDWQRVARAKALVDVAFFTVLSLPPERRREWESALVQAYHERLMELGVTGYDFKQCQNDYRLCAFAPARITLSFGARPDRDLGGPQGKRLQATLIERVAAAMEDLRLAEFL